jgi:hypothetical protein
LIDGGLPHGVDSEEGKVMDDLVGISDQKAWEEYLATCHKLADSMPSLKLTIRDILEKLDEADPRDQALFWGRVAFEFAEIGDDRANGRNAELAAWFSAKARELMKK